MKQARNEDSCETKITRNLPNGYYLIGKQYNRDEWCLIYLYSPGGRGEERQIAFSLPDGGALLPVSDLTEDSLLIPVTICRAEKAITNAELNSVL